MITAGNYPIEVRRGDTGQWNFQLTDTGTGNPIDISGWTITGIAKWDQNTVWYELPIEFTTDGTDGRFFFYIDKATSEALLPVGTPPPDSSSYEVQCSFDNNGTIEVATFLVGTFTVVRDLVRGADASTPNP